MVGIVAVIRRLSRWGPLKPASLTTVVLGLSVGLALAVPGDLDLTFDGDGKKTIDYTGASESAQAVAVQPDGKIVLAGGGNPNRDVAITRLNPDGSYDPSFDGDGVVGVNFGGDDTGQALALQPDGKIVVAGYTNAGATAYDVVVLRLRADGSLDPDFDADGKKTIDYTGTQDTAEAVVVQPDGKVVLAGGGNPNQDVAITRLNPDGSHDASFDGDGVVGVDFGGGEFGLGLALQPDGRAVVAGFTTGVLASHLAVLRLKTDGSLDPDFDGDGKKTINYTGTVESAQAVAVQPDGRIVLAGGGNPNSDFAVTRLNPDGSYDTSFDGDGVVGVDFGGNDTGNALALQSNGKIVIAGEAGGDMALVRLQPGGALDTTFSYDAKVTVDFAGSDRALATALDSEGRIVVAGSANGGADVAIARLKGDPVSEGGGPGPGPGPGTGPGAAGPGPPLCAGKRATIVGTGRRDVLRGTPRADVIVALGGNDVVRGGGGGDLICGGAGNDLLFGGLGRDRLLGGAGKDVLIGGRGPDLCLGGLGLDRATCEVRRSALARG